MTKSGTKKTEKDMISLNGAYNPRGIVGARGKTTKSVPKTED